MDHETLLRRRSVNRLIRAKAAEADLLRIRSDILFLAEDWKDLIPRSPYHELRSLTIKREGGPEPTS